MGHRATRLEQSGLPNTPVRRFVRPLTRFMEIEAAGGIVLLLCTALALLLANSSWTDAVQRFWATPVNLSIGSFALKKNLLLVVNDGLMTLFFFVVGLEIKRELVAGELSDPRKAALPVVAAIGGMIAPALLYLLFLGDAPGTRGWGIPMATDIAFVVGVLALFGKRVPLGLTIMLLTLAIADDIGAVLVIAIAYTDHISLEAFGLGVSGFVVCLMFNRLGVRRVGVYVVVGAFIWVCFLKSGIHPTVAGVLLGLLTPARAFVGDQSLRDVLAGSLQNLTQTPHEEDRKAMVEHLSTVAKESVSPLERLEHALHPWVGFVIMPLFALANAGVTIEPSSAATPVSLAVVLGLFLGKPLGIVLFSYIAVRVGLGRLPTGVNWRLMLGAGFLGGIGFTMSLFVAGLALPSELLEAGKLGTLMGSLASVLVGATILIVCLPKKTTD